MQLDYIRESLQKIFEMPAWNDNNKEISKNINPQDGNIKSYIRNLKNYNFKVIDEFQINDEYDAIVNMRNDRCIVIVNYINNIIAEFIWNYESGKWITQSAAVNDDYQGKGIAFTVYKHMLENHFKTLFSDNSLTGKNEKGSFDVWKKLGFKYNSYLYDSNTKEFKKVNGFTKDMVNFDNYDIRFVVSVDEVNKEQLTEKDDVQLLKNIKIKINDENKDTGNIEYSAYLGENFIGYVSLYNPALLPYDADLHNEQDDQWYIDMAEISNTQYRRKGIMSMIYRHIKNDFGFIPPTGSYRTSDGKKFRKGMRINEMPMINDKHKDISKLGSENELIDHYKDSKEHSKLIKTIPIKDGLIQIFKDDFGDKIYATGYVIVNNKPIGIILGETNNAFGDIHAILKKIPIISMVFVTNNNQGKGYGYLMHKEIINLFGGIISDNDLSGEDGKSGSYGLFIKLSKEFKSYIIKLDSKKIIKSNFENYKSNPNERFLVMK